MCLPTLVPRLPDPVLVPTHPLDDPRQLDDIEALACVGDLTAAAARACRRRDR